MTAFCSPHLYGYKPKDYDPWDQGFGVPEAKTGHKMNGSRPSALRREIIPYSVTLPDAPGTCFSCGNLEPTHDFYLTYNKTNVSYKKRRKADRKHANLQGTEELLAGLRETDPQPLRKGASVLSILNS